jgi:hypothetical protein
MKPIIALVCGCVISSVAPWSAADEVKSVAFGAASVVYDYQPAREGVATLSLNAVISETNDSLRGLKNTDRRRLGKLGQLIYQCKLLLYKPQDGGDDSTAKAPMLISRNYSLYTGVDLRLAAGERLGIRVRALQAVDSASLFAPTLGGDDPQQEVWQGVGDGAAIDLLQVSVDALLENDIIASADNIDILLRFPIFQVERPVQQWSYNFNLGDFRKAVAHADDNCTPARLAGLTEDGG